MYELLNQSISTILIGSMSYCVANLASPLEGMFRIAGPRLKESRKSLHIESRKTRTSLSVSCSDFSDFSVSVPLIGYLNQRWFGNRVSWSTVLEQIATDVEDIRHNARCIPVVGVATVSSHNLSNLDPVYRALRPAGAYTAAPGV